MMSPAAKAYAAKRARNVAKNDTDALDAVEMVADEIMDEGSVTADDDDEGDEGLIVRRPARKAAVQAAVKSKKSYKLDIDEDEDEIEDEKRMKRG